MAHDKSVYASQEALDAFDAGILPVEIAIRWGRKQAIEARGIGSIAGDHLVRADYGTQALRHRGAIFDHHALREETLDRFVVLHQPHVTPDLGPATRVTPVPAGVLTAADALIDGKPLARALAA